MTAYVKTCIVCDEEFRGGRSDRIYCSAKCCRKVRNSKYYNKHAAKMEQKRRAEFLHVEGRLLARSKSRAKKNDIPFDLDLEDIVVPDNCPVLGIPLHKTGGKGPGYHPDSPSLDRIYPELGYVKDNVRVISARANLLKNDATEEELRKVLDDLIHIRSRSR